MIIYNLLPLSSQEPSTFSRLDYCNSLCYSLPKIQLNRLRHIQSSFARVVVATSRSSSSSPGQILKSLHWLKVQERIVYKKGFHYRQASTVFQSPVPLQCHCHPASAIYSLFIYGHPPSSSSSVASQGH